MRKLTFILVALLAFGHLSAQDEKVVKIEFEGLKRTKEAFLKRLIKTKEGAAYDSLLVVKDVERLNRLTGIAKAIATIAEQNGETIVKYTIDENFTIIPGPRISTASDGSFAYQLSLFEFNFLGNGQLLGASFQRNVFNSFSAFWEHPFLFSDKVGFGLNYQNITREEPVFFDDGEKDYRFNSRMIEGKFLFNFDFNNEVELGVVLVDEAYTFEGDDIIPGRPVNLNADKLFYRANYRYVDIDIDYQYFDGFQSEFTGQYIQFQNGNEAGEDFLNDFLSLRNDFIYYKKLGDKGNWANRLRLAAAIGNEDSPFAPFTLDNQLNIRGVGNVVDRGTAAIVLNTEYRHTLYEKGWFVLQSNAFVDLGSWRNPGEDFSQLFDGTSTRLYPGLGIRFIHKKIFNAVFRLDYGIGVGNDTTNGIVFGIGQYF
ncbi:POTRA domain-containing protein [uncultured Croceitalea sp.]|uniref:POTRA domain-containing protein n=1 Tax=uncultured Croceitalea sp. TaxID=1798908 RepID=UPI0033057E0E